MRTPVPFALGLFFLHVTSCLKICAFNIQSFGESKANNKKVMGILLKVLELSMERARKNFWEEWTTDLSLLQPLQILSRCDLCLIQEVRDSKGEAIPALVKHLNRSELFCIRGIPALK